MPGSVSVDDQRRILTYQLVASLAETQLDKLSRAPSPSAPVVTQAFSESLAMFLRAHKDNEPRASKMELPQYVSQFESIAREVVDAMYRAQERATQRQTEKAAIRATKLKVQERVQVSFVKMQASGCGQGYAMCILSLFVMCMFVVCFICQVDICLSVCLSFIARAVEFTYCSI